MSQMCGDELRCLCCKGINVVNTDLVNFVSHGRFLFLQVYRYVGMVADEANNSYQLLADKSSRPRLIIEPHQ